MAKSKIPWIGVIIVLAVISYALYSARDIGPSGSDSSLTPAQKEKSTSSSVSGGGGGGGGVTFTSQGETSKGVDVDVTFYDKDNNPIIPQTQSIMATINIPGTGNVANAKSMKLRFTITNVQTNNVPIKDIEISSVTAKGATSSVLSASMPAIAKFTLNPGESKLIETNVIDMTSFVGQTGYGGVDIRMDIAGKIKPLDPTKPEENLAPTWGTLNLNFQKDKCSDGTDEGVCNENSKQYCYYGTSLADPYLGYKASACGCPLEYVQSGDNCVPPTCDVGGQIVNVDTCTSNKAINGYCDPVTKAEISNCQKCSYDATHECQPDTSGAYSGFCNMTTKMCQWPDTFAGLEVGVGATGSTSPAFDYSMSLSGSSPVNTYTGTQVSKDISFIINSGNAESVSITTSAGSVTPSSCTLPCSSPIPKITFTPTSAGTTNIVVTSTSASNVAKSSSFSVVASAPPANVVFRTNVDTTPATISNYVSSGPTDPIGRIPTIAVDYDGDNNLDLLGFNSFQSSTYYNSFCGSGNTQLATAPGGFLVKRYSGDNRYVSICPTSSGNFYRYHIYSGKDTSVPISKASDPAYATRNQEAIS